MNIYVIKTEKFVNEQKICDVYKNGFKTYEEAKSKLLSESYEVFNDMATNEERFIKNDGDIIKVADIKKITIKEGKYEEN